MLTNQGINEDPKLGQPEKGPGIVEHMKMEHNMGKKDIPKVINWLQMHLFGTVVNVHT